MPHVGGGRDSRAATETMRARGTSVSVNPMPTWGRPAIAPCGDGDNASARHIGLGEPDAHVGAAAMPARRAVPRVMRTGDARAATAIAGSRDAPRGGGRAATAIAVSARCPTWGPTDELRDAG